MFVLVLAAEADETRQTMTLLIVCLIGIAIALSLLTVWYWFATNPKRGAVEAGRPGSPRLELEASAAADDTLASGVAIVKPVDDSAPAGSATGRTSTGAGSESDSDSEVGIDPPPEEEPALEAEPAVAAVAAGHASVEPARSAEVPEMAIELAAELRDQVVSARPQTWDFVAAARQAEEGDSPSVRSGSSADSDRARVPDRSGWLDESDDDGDELAAVRRRRQRSSRGLSDDAWESVRRSVFDKLDS